jgi:hypothetical protein
MAYTIKYNPDDRYISAHEDVMFVVLEDTKPFTSTTYPNYKYVCDIYIKDASNVETLATRLKSYPQPGTKYGVFNIGNVVRNYINTTFAPNPGAIMCQKMGADYFYVQVICRFGEEYNNVVYPNLVIDSQRAYFNHYNERQYGTNTILTNYKDKLLTNRPYATPISRNATNCFIPFFPSDDTSYNVQFRCYNKDLGFITSSSFNFTPTSGSIDELQQLNVAPGAVNSIIPGTITDIIDYYTVTLDTTNIPDDSVYRFDLVCERKYQIKTLHFLNKLGGFESKEFIKVSRKTNEITRTGYGKPPYIINSNGSVSWFDSTTKVYQEQKTNFASEWSDKMQLNSDLLTDAEYVWLGELLKSTMVYIEIGGYFFPVTITDTNYEERKIINDKLTNLTVNIEFGETFNAQFR